MKKYLVETNGAVGVNFYSATDPDEAARLARRHETFLRLVCTTKSGKEAITEATRLTEEGDPIPDFKIRRVEEVAK